LLDVAFEDLKNNHSFYVDPGIWCCQSCARADAWEEGAGKQFVLWHEQSEERLHNSPSSGMHLYFGVARQDASDSEVADTARTIINVLAMHGFSCTWKDGDVKSAILVNHGNYIPQTNSKEGEGSDSIDVLLYIPLNDKTKECCENPSDEEYGEPPGTYYFTQTLKEGESLVDAVRRVDPAVREFISHYQRRVYVGECSYDLECITEIQRRVGHLGSGDSLLCCLKGIDPDDYEDEIRREREKSEREEAMNKAFAKRLRKKGHL
jgi:hypothetical protein